MTITVTVPEAWEDIKLSQYVQYMKAIKPYEGTEDFEIIRLEKAINHFCNVSTEELRSLNIENYNGIVYHIQELFNSIDTTKLVRTFKILDTTFGFIPNLDDMTYGEYLDLSTYSKDLWNNLPTFLSIVYRPVTKTNGKSYQIESYNGTDEEIISIFNNTLTMDTVWGTVGFFYLLQKDLANGTLTCLSKRMKELGKDSALMETLTKNGVDTSQLLSSLETTLQGLKQLQN